MLFPRVIRPSLLSLVILAALVPAARADVVVGKVLPLRQPDGSVFQARIWGDEFYSVVESLDGYTLVRDPDTKYICYARLAEDARTLLSTGVVVGAGSPAVLGLVPHLRIGSEAAAEQARAAREAFERLQVEGPWAPPAQRDDQRGPTTGSVQGICLIIDFSDDAGTIPPATVNNFCNQIGYNLNGNNGSVRDYFYDVSNGLLTYTNYVPAAYYRALYPKTYYNDPDIQYGQRARELIIEALTALENSGFDFSQYDADGNGIVDALNCFYAGDSESAWSEGLWPHAGGLYYCADGVCTQRYQITDMQSALRLSTFCHENGHMLLGWPDLYDYDYDSSGVGRFCLMCYGTTDTNPCEPCAYMKLIAGWTDTVLLTTPTVGLPVVYGSNTIYKYPHPTLTREYYLIENRQRTGRDAGLPDAGLAIWHVDTQGSNNNQQQTPALHYKVTLVQADGEWDLENYRNYGDSTDLWAAPTYTQCAPDTSPNTNWWSGASSELYISSISESGATMYFSFLNGPDCNSNGIVDTEDIANCDGSPWCYDCNGNGLLDACDIEVGWSLDCNENGAPDECDTAAGVSLDCNSNGTPDECDIAYGWYPDDNDNLVPDPCEWYAGDVNCDGTVSFGDINPFVLLISNTTGYLDAFPNCIRLNGDINGDGAADFGDINAFVQLLTSGG